MRVPLWVAFLVFMAALVLALLAVQHWPWLIAPLLVLALVDAIWQAVTRR